MTLTLAGVLNLAGPPLLAKVKKSFFCEASLWPIFSLHRLICLLIKYATVRIFYWYLPHTFYIFEKTYWATSRCWIIRPDKYTYIIYRVFIKYCDFSKILIYFPDSVFSRCQCVYTHKQVDHQRCSRTGRVKKNHNILRKNSIFNEHPL